MINKYKLHSIVANGWVYIRIRKGMYGLPQAGLLANIKLRKQLATHRHFPTVYTPDLWKHESNAIVSTLTVDDFLIKYSNKADADHLLKMLKEQYAISEDWTSHLYYGVHLDWNYQERTCILFMPNYVEKALKSYQHKATTRAQYAPHPWLIPPKILALYDPLLERSNKICQ